MYVTDMSPVPGESEQSLDIEVVLLELASCYQHNLITL
jgi:hypothetical protein